MVQPLDLPRIIEEAKMGRLEFRMDRTAIIHCPVGKVSFTSEKLLGNIASLIDSVVKSRPAAIKGSFVRSAYLSASMSPSLRLNLQSLMAMQPDV
jgi:large subunit ribosomal protein L1